MDEEIDLRDDAPREIDLSDRLRFAAVSLAADYSDRVTADHAEALVFSSAEGLLATASVTEFVPILAERRARHAVRSGEARRPEAAVPAPPAPAVDAPAPAAPTPNDAPAPAAPTPNDAPAPAAPTPNGALSAEPLFAVGDEAMSGLRDRVDRARVRVSDWRAELAGR